MQQHQQLNKNTNNMAHDKNNFVTHIFASLVCIILLCATQTAQADFRKALTAYQNRDGKTMLAEVQDAVDKKNDDGLVLLFTAIIFDANTSKKDDLYQIAANQKTSTLKTILSNEQQLELFTLMSKVSERNKSDIDPYLLFPGLFIADESRVKQLNANRPTNEEYAKQGSKMGLYQTYISSGKADPSVSRSETQNEWRLKYAESGDATTQFYMGLEHNQYVGDYGCDDLTTELICQKKDEAKGNYWLKLAARGFEASRQFGSDRVPSVSIYAEGMCNFMHKSANGDVKKLKQAYLWCLFSFNSGSSEAYGTLGRMQQAGELKRVAPRLDAIWHDTEKRSKMLLVSQLNEVPALILEARKLIAKQKLPVFSFYINDYLSYQLDVYQDGRVSISTYKFVPNDTSGDTYLLMQVSPNKIKNFLEDLKKTGFYQWPLSNMSPEFSRGNIFPQTFQFTFRSGTNVRKVYFSEHLAAALKAPATEKIKRIAKIAALVEKYFPTRHLRCELGNSTEYKSACLARDKQWITLTKEEK